MKFAYATGSRPLDGYTIKRGVGIGGFGEVYFALSDAGKEVALKRIQKNLDVEVRGVSQCLNLKHPNLISLHDIRYDEHGEGWIVMEFVAGESLKDVIERNPNGLPLEHVNLWFQAIGRGVSYLHDHGIVHRDLKPGNIFDDDGVVKIGDYGLSKFISCSRRSGQTESVGTFHYMAPEIGKGVYGKEIDIYALGILLYEMITGRVPFEGETSQEIIMKHLTADPDLTGLPSPYREVVRRALVKDPDKRFFHVRDMLKRLNLSEGDPTSSREPIAVATAVPEIQPLVSPVRSQRPQRETIYINEENADEIVFGPVKQGTPRPGAPRGNPIAFAPLHGASVTAAARAINRPAASEPVAQAVCDGIGGLANWWRYGNMSSPLKVLILLVAMFGLMLNAAWLVPVSVVLGAVYLVYLVLRAFVLAVSGTPTQAQPRTMAARPATEPAQPRRPQRERVNREQWLVAARRTLAKKTAAMRMSELTGSMISAAVVTTILGLVMLFASGHSLTGSVDVTARYAWVALSATVGAWVVLVAGKFWEGHSGDSIHRRFWMMVAGLVLGVVVYGTGDFLRVNLPQDALTARPFLRNVYPDNMESALGPTLPAYMMFFAGLFAIQRWWIKADPVRGTKFSLWATLVSVLWSLALPLSQPWGTMLAATTSLAVQLSAPWMNPQERSAIREELVRET